MLVADPVVAKTDAFAKIDRKLEGAKVNFLLYDRVEPEAPLALAEEVAELARRKKVDRVLAVWGGSTMDVAKAAALSLTNLGRVESYLGTDLVKSRVSNKVGFVRFADAKTVTKPVRTAKTDLGS